MNYAQTVEAYRRFELPFHANVECGVCELIGLLVHQVGNNSSSLPMHTLGGFA